MNEFYNIPLMLRCLQGHSGVLQFWCKNDTSSVGGFPVGNNRALLVVKGAAAATNFPTVETNPTVSAVLPAVEYDTSYTYATLLPVVMGKAVFSGFGIIFVVIPVGGEFRASPDDKDFLFLVGPDPLLDLLQIFLKD